MSSHGAKHPAALSPARTQTRQSESVCVEIQGRRLSIRTNHDPSFVHELATYVDAKLDALQRAAPSAPLEKLLMLVSMTVAEELFSTREELHVMQRHVQDRVQALHDILDAHQD